MAQRVLSITLGSEIVKICEASLAGKNKVQVYNAIDLVIPEGLCEDGVIQDAEGLAKAITEGLKGEGFTSKKIVFSISSKRIASKEATIPYCKENRINDIVQINASEYFPISNLEDYIVNYSILEVVQNDSVKNYRLSVVATPKEIVADYHELAKFMGMSVVHIDYAGNALLQLLKLQTVGSEVVAILQMSGENTVVSIMNGKTMVMQRSVPYGRGVLVDAIVQSRNVPENVADLMLIEEDISDIASSNEEVADAVRSLFSSINRIIEFYSGRNHDKPIEHIYMIGDVISVNGLVDLFNREWAEHEVELIGHLHGVEIKNFKNVSYEIASNYLSNLGALIAPLNIVIQEEKSKKKKGGLPWWILIFSGVISAAMIGGVLFMYNTEKEEVDSIQRQIDAIGEVKNLESEYQEVQSELSVMQNWYDSTKSANESIAKFIDDLELVQPSSVGINQFNANAGEIRLTGTASNKSDVAQFIIELKKLPYVLSVDTDYISESIEDYMNKDTFSMTIKLDYDDPYASEEDVESEEEVLEESTENSSVDGIEVENIAEGGEE